MSKFNREDGTFSDVTFSDLSGALNSSQLTSAIAFSAHKNGTDQVGVADASFTTVTWPTEAFDAGSYFASNAWTPPAGKVLINSQVTFSGAISTGTLCAIRISPNNTQANTFAVNNLGVAIITALYSTNGSTAYSIEAFIDTATSTGTISGAAVNTYFNGVWLGK